MNRRESRLKLLLGILFVFVLAQTGIAHSLEPFIGWTCEGGILCEDDHNGGSVSMSGVALYLNGSLDYMRWDSRKQDDRDEFRGYLGVGIGPIAQLQAGYGTDETLSARLKTTWSIRQLVRKTTGFRSGFPGSESESWLGFHSPDGWLTRGFTIGGFAEYREGGEWLGGVQLGLLIW